MKRCVDKYHALQQAALTITSELSLDRVLKKLVDVARDLAQAQYAALGVAAEDRMGLAQFIVSGMTDRQIAAIGPWPRGLGLLGALLRDPRPLRVRDIGKHPRSIGFPPGHPAMTSFLGVPIISKDTILGNFYLTNKIDAEEFSADDEELIVALAAFAAVTIENARLYSETDAQLQRKLVALERAEKRARFLLELSALLPTGPLAEELPLEAVLAGASSQLGDACAAYLVGPDGQVDRKMIVHRDPARANAAGDAVAELWDAVRERVFEKERSFFVADVDAPRTPLPGFETQAMKARGFTAGLAVPIKSTNRVFGVFLSLASQPIKLSEDDLLFGQLVAARLGTVLENAALLHELKGALNAKEGSIAELRKAEQGLSHLAAIVESSDDSIVSWTMDGIIASWNPSAERLYGYSAEEAVGQPVSMLFPPDRPNELPGILERLEQGQRISPFESVRVRRDGRRVPVSARVSPIKDKSGRILGASSITRDISELKLAEKALRESEERFRALVTASSDVLYRMSPDWSEMRQLHSRGTLANTDSPSPTWLQEYIHPDDQPHVTAVINEAIRTKSIFELEHRVRRADGSFGWTFSRAVPLLDANGEIVEWFGAASDITDRKQAEEWLRESEEEYRATFEQAAVGVAHIGLDGRYLRVNEQLCAITGYSADELTGLTVQDITYPADNAADLELSRRLLAGEIPTYSRERRYVSKDGSLVWVNMTASLLRYPSGKPKHLIYVVEDIARRKQSEEALRMLSAAVEQSPSTVIITDTQARIEYVNPNFTELTGYTSEEVMGQNPSFLKSGHTSAEEYRQLWDTISSGRMWRGHFLNKKKSGDLYWESASIAPITDAEGTITHYVALKQDITERKAADAERERLLAAVQQRAAELDAVITSIADMVLIYDPSGKIVRMNAAAEQVLGYSPVERDLPLADRVALLGPETSESRLLPPEDTPTARALRGETVNGFVMRLRMRDRGNWVIAGAAPLRAPDGKLLGAVVTLSDITQLRELQEQHEEYVALISHDLRTPLTGMLGQADLLRKRMEQRNLTQEAQIAAAVVKSARRMNTMIQELVDSARLEAGHLDLNKKLTDLPKLVRDVVERIADPEERARVALEAATSVPSVMVDAERIERVVTNLVSNALKYSPPNSPVAVRLAPQGDQWVLSVTDMGVGIPVEDIPHLFQRYYRAQTAQHYEGLGLGLYISQLITEAHGGRISVESAVGKGSTFYLALPVATMEREM